MKKRTIFFHRLTLWALALCLSWGCSDHRNGGAGEHEGVRPMAKTEVAVGTEQKDTAVRAEAEAAPEEKPQKEPPQDEGVMMSLMGNIGGSAATLDMDGREGFYEYELHGGKVKGNLELVSYDRKSGRVVLKALDKSSGKLIGHFDGTFTIECATDDEGEEHCMNSYTGVFTNMKGAKTDFMLYID